MLKKDARALFRQKRAAVSALEQSRWDDLLLIRFQQVQLPFLNAALSFYPANDRGEVDSFLITRFLQFANPGLQVAFPRIGAGSSMSAVVPANDDDYLPNSYQILEPTGNHLLQPEEIDLVLVPLLAFDKKGNRAGYGKGYYDRFLQQCRPNCIKLGLSYFEPVDLLEDASEYDIPLDLCITPQATYVF